MALNFTEDFYNALKSLFPNTKFSVTGVFCHQKPIVNIGEKSCPELGDILFVYISTDKGGNKKLNSLLLQAKISQKTSVKLKDADKDQLKLYEEWPEFTYKRAGKNLNGKKRDILPKTINDGAQYLLIDDHDIFGLSGLSGTFPMGFAIPGKTLHLNNNLAEELVDFLKFKAGRPFEEDYKKTKDDWTKMIWDLLNLTEGKASKRINSGLSRFPRKYLYLNEYDGYYIQMLETNSIYKLDRKIENEEVLSPSIILIESNDTDQNNQQE